MVGKNPEKDAQDLFDLLDFKVIQNKVLNTLSLEKVKIIEVPVNSISHKRHHVILMEHETQILSSQGKCLLFNRDVLYYTTALAKELNGVIKRADKVLTTAQRSTMTSINVIVKRTARKLLKYEQRKRRIKRLEEDEEKEKRESSDNGISGNNTTDMDMPSMPGGEHEPVQGEQTDNVQQLHSNNNTQQNKGV